MFPELRPYLEEAWELAEPGTEYVITRYRDSHQNLRTQLRRIIERAGLAQWPKLFQNLRATRKTELAEQYPMHVVYRWIGNSEPVAAKHYLQFTDEHFNRAIGGGETANKEAAQNAAQYAPESVCKAEFEKQQTPVIPEEYGNLPSCTSVHVAEAGLEPARPVKGRGF